MPFDQQDTSWDSLSSKIIGLGEKSIRKNYYPQLKRRISELEQSVEVQKILSRILEITSLSKDSTAVYTILLRELSGYSSIPEQVLQQVTFSPLSHQKETMVLSMIKGKDHEPRIEDISSRYPFTIFETPILINEDVCGHFRIYAKAGSELPSSVKGHLTTIIHSIIPSLHRIEVSLEKQQIERQLQINQKIQALGTLSSGIAHDFNNILSVIYGYSELAMMSAGEDAAVTEYLNGILEGAKRAKALTEQILSFSRMESNELHRISLQKIIRGVASMLDAVIPSTMTIELDIDEQVSEILGNRSQLQQVLMNLATNAYQAMSEHGGTLRMTLREVYVTGQAVTSILPGAYAYISVEDTGCGMDDETCRHMFDPYFTTKKLGEGTGLGLSVVHGIISSLQGAIQAESEIDRGTVFHIYLPISQSEAGEQSPDRYRSSKDQSLRRGTERIILVDDDQQILASMKQMLTSLGYTVSAISSSIDAAAIFEQQECPADLLITDMTMPRMTGAQLSERVLSFWPDLPVIMMTGFSETFNAEKAEALGISRFLLKPVLMKDLADMIRTVLD